MSFRSTWCGRWRKRSRRSAGTSNSWSTSTTRRSLRRQSQGCRWTSWSGISAIRAAALAPWSNAASLDAFLRLFETGRCWVKLTGPYRISAAPDLPYPDVVPLARRLAGVNPDRLIWGTDWPHVMNKKPMPNDGDLTDLIADWLPDAALRERVLVTNPAALYGFAGGESLGAKVA